MGEVLLTVVGQGSPERPFQPSDSDVDRSDPDPVLPSNGGSPSVECGLWSSWLLTRMSLDYEEERRTCRKRGIPGTISKSICSAGVCPYVVVPSVFRGPKTCSEVQG
jgi:hypothetical protein